MLNRLQITLILGIAVVAWVVSLFVRGTPVTVDHLVPFGIAVSAVTVLCTTFDKWCWRYGVFKGWLVARPWLQGTWRVTLQSNWVDPATGRQVGPIEGFMAIRQTFSALHMRLYTAESSSVSVTASILKSEDCLYRVAAVYQNEPSASLRGVRSEIHYGSLLLHVHADPPVTMTGHYWTDRSTTGTLDFRDRKPKLVSNFADGVSLFAEPA